MKNLKEYIFESLLDDEEDILDKQDKIFLDPVKWFHVIYCFFISI